jgi:hypothetical protein
LYNAATFELQSIANGGSGWVASSGTAAPVAGSTTDGAGQFTFVTWGTQPIRVDQNVLIQVSATAVAGEVGHKFDGNASFAFDGIYQGFTANSVGSVSVPGVYTPTLGFHFIAGVYLVAGGTCTFTGPTMSSVALF